MTFPAVLDSTIIAAFRSCGQKANLEFFQHYKPKSQSVHLVAGAAYAAGLEAARKAFFELSESPDRAKALGLQALMASYGSFECPADSAKSLERTAGALEFYLDRYPLETDQAVPITLLSGKRGIELSFVEPIDLEDALMIHPDTGDPLLYCGRADQVVEFQQMILGEDDKTTSSLGATWPLQWNLRSQFTGYSWGFRRMKIDLQGWLIRGVSILKTKYDTMEAITYRPEWQIERWHKQLKKDVLRMIKAYRNEEWDFNLDHSCNEYGGCLFREVCQMHSPAILLEQRFQRRMWNPVTREELVLGEEEIV